MLQNRAYDEAIEEYCPSGSCDDRHVFAAPVGLDFVLVKNTTSKRRLDEKIART